LKSILAMRKMPDKVMLSKDLLKESQAAFEALMPLVHFINRALGD